MTTPLVSQLMTELNQFLTQDSVDDQEKTLGHATND
ncbi:hypothetical protein S101258_02797 [Lactiplantibacillus plantarum subsp. plantarum]|uniref:Uncharacterized protein n=1 Tax=Lactiplantibacillus plantarum subsp. plantarum TaxID=337330 RepID=A0A2S3U2K2_LACPN|nr:hypothetical protein S101258_02797 [Lactiplantibacillus plantarum subsp. plantarum]